MKSNYTLCLINPPSSCVEDDRIEPPLGLLYIAANLKRNYYENVILNDMSGCKNDEEISSNINNIFDASIYGITCFSTNYQYAKKIIKKIRVLNPSAYLVLGGPNATGIPEFTFKDSGVDAVVSGEGEDSFVECVNSFFTSSIIKGIIKGKFRANIDSYPFPARDLVDMKTYSRRLLGNPVISILSSRGCKYQCIHCNSTVMGSGSRGKVRYRSVKNIIEEIESLRNEFKYYRFNDDHFTGNPNLPCLLERIEDLDINFRVFARIEDLDNKTCQLLKKAGCVHVSIGLESLNPANLRILGKATQIGREKNVKIAKSHGLVVRASFMVGLPFDTVETINKYFQAASQLGLDEFAVYPLIPYPGTLIWKCPERFGYTIINHDFRDYVQIGRSGKTCYALKHENFGPEDVEIWKKNVEKIFESSDVKHMRESVIAT